jgi:hypothetical protein
MMSQRVPITYRDFYDVPRIFLASHQGILFLFDCEFDDDVDDYPDVYKVFVMPALERRDLHGSWERLSQSATRYLGEVPVNLISFDETRRRTIDTEVLQNLLQKNAF